MISLALPFRTVESVAFFPRCINNCLSLSQLMPLTGRPFAFVMTSPALRPASLAGESGKTRSTAKKPSRIYALVWVLFH